MSDLIPFSFETHGALMGSWLKARDMEPWSQDECPAIGFVSTFKGKPIAMAFLRMVEGGFAQMDGLVTDPEAPGFLRHAANDDLTALLIFTAGKLNLKGLYVISSDVNTIVRAENHGLTRKPQLTLLTRRI